MILHAISFVLGVVLGSIAVLLYVHKHTAAAVAIAAKAATDVAAVVADVKKV